MADETPDPRQLIMEAMIRALAGRRLSSKMIVARFLGLLIVLKHWLVHDELSVSALAARHGISHTLLAKAVRDVTPEIQKGLLASQIVFDQQFRQFQRRQRKTARKFQRNPKGKR